MPIQDGGHVFSSPDLNLSTLEATKGFTPQILRLLENCKSIFSSPPSKPTAKVHVENPKPKSSVVSGWAKKIFRFNLFNKMKIGQSKPRKFEGPHPGDLKETPKPERETFRREPKPCLCCHLYHFEHGLSGIEPGSSAPPWNGTLPGEEGRIVMGRNQGHPILDDRQPHFSSLTNSEKNPLGKSSTPSCFYHRPLCSTRSSAHQRAVPQNSTRCHCIHSEPHPTESVTLNPQNSARCHCIHPEPHPTESVTLNPHSRTSCLSNNRTDHGPNTDHFLARTRDRIQHTNCLLKTEASSLTSENPNRGRYRDNNDEETPPCFQTPCSCSQFRNQSRLSFPEGPGTCCRSQLDPHELGAWVSSDNAPLHCQPNHKLPNLPRSFSNSSQAFCTCSLPDDRPALFSQHCFKRPTSCHQRLPHEHSDSHEHRPLLKSASLNHFVSSRDRVSNHGQGISMHDPKNGLEPNFVGAAHQVNISTHDPKNGLEPNFVGAAHQVNISTHDPKNGLEPNLVGAAHQVNISTHDSRLGQLPFNKTTDRQDLSENLRVGIEPGSSSLQQLILNGTKRDNNSNESGFPFSRSQQKNFASLKPKAKCPVSIPEETAPASGILDKNSKPVSTDYQTTEVKPLQSVDPCQTGSHPSHLSHGSQLGPVKWTGVEKGSTLSRNCWLCERLQMHQVGGSLQEASKTLPSDPRSFTNPEAANSVSSKSLVEDGDPRKFSIRDEGLVNVPSSCVEPRLEVGTGDCARTIGLKPENLGLLGLRQKTQTKSTDDLKNYLGQHKGFRYGLKYVAPKPDIRALETLARYFSSTPKRDPLYAQDASTELAYRNLTNRIENTQTFKDMSILANYSKSNTFTLPSSSEPSYTHFRSQRNLSGYPSDEHFSQSVFDSSFPLPEPVSVAHPYRNATFHLSHQFQNDSVSLSTGSHSRFPFLSLNLTASSKSASGVGESRSGVQFRHVAPTSEESNYRGRLSSRRISIRGDLEIDEEEIPKSTSLDNEVF